MSALDFTRFGGDYFLPDKISDGNNYAAKKMQWSSSIIKWRAKMR